MLTQPPSSYMYILMRKQLTLLFLGCLSYSMSYLVVLVTNLKNICVVKFHVKFQKIIYGFQFRKIAIKAKKNIYTFRNCLYIKKLRVVCFTNFSKDILLPRTQIGTFIVHSNPKILLVCLTTVKSEAKKNQTKIITQHFFSNCPLLQTKKKTCNL